MSAPFTVSPTAELPQLSERCTFVDLADARAWARRLLDQRVESTTVDADANVRGETIVVPTAP